MLIHVRLNVQLIPIKLNRLLPIETASLRSVQSSRERCWPFYFIHGELRKKGDVRRINENGIVNFVGGPILKHHRRPLS